MLGESLRVPFRAADWIGTILVGSVLTLLVGLVVAIWLVVLAFSPPIGGLLIPLVALPSLVLRGYLIGVVRSGLDGEPTVDSFVRWGRLVRDGTRSTLISAIYLIPAAALLGLALGGAVATVVDPEGFEGAVQAIAALVILGGGFGLLIYGLVYLYVRPAARAVFAATGSVRAALDVRRVGRLSVTGDYITGWLIGMGVLVVGPTLLFPLLVISLAAGVVSPPLAFVGVLSTILLGIGTGFVCRVSAAWATGRGSAVGVVDLYPSAAGSSTDGSVTRQLSEPSDPSGAVEPPVAVQTGRTVDVDADAAGSATASADESMEADAVDRDGPPEGVDKELSGLPIQPQSRVDSDAEKPDNAAADSADERPEVKDDRPEVKDERPEVKNETDTDDETATADAEDDDPTADEFIWGPDNGE